MTRKYKIAVLLGDGIGPEVVSSASRVLKRAAEKHSLELELLELPIGLHAYSEYGRTLPPETLENMRACDGWILGPSSGWLLPEG